MILAATTQASNGAAAAVAIVYVLFLIVAYVVSALSYQRIALRTQTSNSWMAWVPILNVFLLLRICGRSLWEVFILVIPFVNLVYMVCLLVWLPQRIGRSGWWAVPLMVPIVNLGVLPYLAFSESY